MFAVLAYNSAKHAAEVRKKVQSIVIVDREATLNVTKADIVDKIAGETGLTKLETKAVVDGFLLSIIDALAEGNRIELRGFGVFSVKSRKPRMARNPRTGDPVPLEERFIPAFKVSSEFQEKVHDKLRPSETVRVTEG